MTEKEFNSFPYFEDIHGSSSDNKPSEVFDTAMLPPTINQKIIPRDYQNVLVYEPKNYNDVQTLIDFLKRREPAIINLDSVSPEVAQRVLDFTSGAVYALSGSILRISGNIFLLSPEGVGVTIPNDIS